MLFPSPQNLSPEELKLFQRYGKVPNQANHFARNNQRKYFDSGDYALNKAGKGDGVDTGNVGSIVPDVDTIRHASVPNASGTPTPGGVPGSASSSSVNVTPAAGGSNVPAPPPTLTKSGSVSVPSSGIPVGSPAKESSLHRETSAEDAQDEEEKENEDLPIRT